MFRSHCPACFQPSALKMFGVSALAAVDYFRCRLCDHIWTVAPGRETVFTHVRPLTFDPADSMPPAPAETASDAGYRERR